MIRMTLLKYVEGPWDHVRQGLHQDLETIEVVFNRLGQQIAADIAAATATSTDTDVVPDVLLLAGLGSRQSTSVAAADDPLVDAFLVMGG